MIYKIIKIWYNGGRQVIEETEDGTYADKRVKELNSRIDLKQKNQPIKYSIKKM